MIVFSATPTSAQSPPTARAINLAQPAQELQVMFDVRIISVVDDGLERIGVDFETRTTPDVVSGVEKGIHATPSNPVFLTEKQCAELMKSLAGDRRMSVLSEPRTTTLDGQTASVVIGQSENCVTQIESVQRDGKLIVTPKTEEITTGLHLEVTPVVSADRRSIRVNVKVAETERAAATSRPTSQKDFDVTRAAELGRYAAATSRPTSQKDCCEGCPVCGTSVQAPAVNTQSVEKTVVIPDGGTTLILGPKKTVEVRTEYSVPVISRIPYVERLFRNVGYAQETRQMIVLVTPHIIAPEPEEAKPCGNGRTGSAEAPTPVRSVGSVWVPIAPVSEVCLTKPEVPQSRMAKVVSDLVTAYREACAAGHTDEAEKLARAALLLDPTCFARK
jgi:type II secretory pathway component GspD/PulD (secretin)